MYGLVLIFSILRGTMFLLFITFLLAPTGSLAQSVQDDWTFPESPDYSSTLISGHNYTIAWTPALRNNFDTYCSSCDVSNVDLLATGAASDQVHHVGGRKLN